MFRLAAGQPKNRGLIPSRDTSFLFYPESRPALKVNHPHIEIAPVATSPGLKRPGRETNYSPPFSIEIKSEWSCTSFPLYAVMATQGRMYLHILWAHLKNFSKVSVSFLLSVRSNVCCPHRTTRLPLNGFA